MNEPSENLPPILPPGTQVLVQAEACGGDAAIHRRGTPAVIVQSPTEPLRPYRVRYVDGSESTFGRAELSVLSSVQGIRDRPERVSFDPRLFDHVIYRCVIGSRAYGLDDETSDTDLRGIYLPPADLHWSLQGAPERLENPETEEVYWELQKFITLALRANPNVLECLYTPLVEYASPLARRVLDTRSAFLSKLVYPTYNGYAMSQFKKLQADVRQRGAAKPKHLLHLIRLLLAGIATLRDGAVPVRVNGHRDRLLAIKHGEIGFDEVEPWRQQLHREFDSAYEKTTLPDRPDYALADAILIDARRSSV